MSIHFHKAGILTTVQDLGRDGFRRFGVNQNGAMDKSAARLINCLLGNDEAAALLEMHFPAPEILFEKPAIFAVGGADFVPSLNGEKIENWRIHFAPQNSVLKFTEKFSGNRAYLAVEGGFKIPDWLGSASTNLKAKIGGFRGRSLQPGDGIFLNKPAREFPPKVDFRVSASIIPRYSNFPTVRAVAGAEFERVKPESRKNFEKNVYQIAAHSDRMGFRLQGEPIFLKEHLELLSSAVDFGTVQLLPDGQLIVLMADHQTSGGYPRIAAVAATDLPLLAQLTARDRLAFQLISIREAENLSIEFERNLARLKIGLKYR